MLRVEFKIWYGGFAKHVLENIICEEARNQFIHIKIARDCWDKYTFPTRVYHNEYHVYWIYQHAWENDIVLTQAQELAILFHDIIYTVGDKNNEELSADYCWEIMSPHVEDTQVVEDACDIIRDTAQHFALVPQLTNEQSGLVLDLDIMSMSLPYSEFIKWNHAIDKEYKIKFGGSIDTTKRVEFLKKFLKKKPLLFEDMFKDREQQIRENLHHLIRELEMGK